MSSTHNANAASRKIAALHAAEEADKNPHVHEHGADPLHSSHKEAVVKKAPVAHGHSGGKPAAKPAEGEKKDAAPTAAAKPADKKK